MISNGDIADNLYSLYGGLAERGLVASGSAGGFEYVRHDGFAWPNMAYRPGRNGPASREELQLLRRSILSGECPRLVLFDGEGMTDEVRGALAADRLIGATEWVNMYRQVGRTTAGSLKCRVIDADDPQEWSRWASVVSGVLFKNQPLDRGLFGDRFSLMTGYMQDEAVATCLLYFGKSAGLYMVATFPSFQGKGYGGQLMEYAQRVAADRGYETVVLHSTKAGLAFYNSLGFKSVGKLYLYYSMP